MKSYRSPLLVLAAGVLPQVMAWGSLGHATIAYVAQNYVSSTTETYFQTLLNDTSDDYLASIASWADSYRYTTAGEFSASFHYIDANDDPPTTCDVDYDRDCGDDGCIVSAIVNYTHILTDGRYSDAHKSDAAKFIVHFFGDIHQPLHDEDLLVGGNDIDVTYDGDDVNLHSTWDTYMPEDYTDGGYALSDASAWATTLVKAINSGTYKSDASGWLDALDLDDVQGSAMQMATDSNAYVCTVVMPDGYTVLESEDLSGDYYTSCLPTIQLQFARAGYRLAAWLNLINDGETGL